MEPDLSDQPTESPEGVPTPLRVAAVVVALEAAFIVVFGATEALHTHANRAVMGVTTALFFVAFGIGIAVCAWGLFQVRSWARGPVMLTQLMALGLAWNFNEGETKWIAVVLMIPAIIGLVAMLHPKTLAALNE